MDAIQQVNPAIRRDGEIEESLDDIVSCHGGTIGFQIVANLGRSLLGALARHLQEGENYEGKVALKLFLCLLQLHLRSGSILPIKGLDSVDYGRNNLNFNGHFFHLFLVDFMHEFVNKAQKYY